jgi:hypothetical protein
MPDSFLNKIVFESQREDFFSEIAGDSFDLYLQRPSGTDPLPVLIYLDAHLPSGRRIPQVVRKMQDTGIFPDLLLVGIGHQKSYFRKRNRDFIPPPRLVEEEFISKKKGYGQAKLFFRFLTSELIPFLREEHQVREDWAICGHSLGGLFTLYSMLQPDTPFNRVISLSPSVWINRRNLLRIGASRRADGGKLSGRLYLAAGAMEEFNLILPGMRAFEGWAAQGEGSDLVLKSEAIPWKNHFSVVRPGVQRGLEWIYRGD